MSYDIRMKYVATACEERNISYNSYEELKCLGNKGIRELYGKTGKETITMLRQAVIETNGVTQNHLINLLILASLHLDGIWEGD